MHICVWSDSIKSDLNRGSVEQQKKTHTVANGMEASQSCVIFKGWQVYRHRVHSIGLISVHGPCGSLAYLMVDAALRNWPALQLWENGKAWWSVGEVHQCWVSTYSRLQADLTNLQREKEIRLQTQQKWSIITSITSLDASWTPLNWLILPSIWTCSS